MDTNGVRRSGKSWNKVGTTNMVRHGYQWGPHGPRQFSQLDHFLAYPQHSQVISKVFHFSTLFSQTFSFCHPCNISYKRRGMRHPYGFSGRAGFGMRMPSLGCGIPVGSLLATSWRQTWQIRPQTQAEKHTPQTYKHHWGTNGTPIVFWCLVHF